MALLCKILAAATLPAVVSGCLSFGVKPPDEPAVPAVPAILAEETVSVLVEPDSTSRPGHPRFLATFTVEKSWREGAEGALRSDREVHSKQLKLDEPWQPVIPLSRGDFSAELTVFAVTGYRLSAMYWTPAEGGTPGLDWWRQLTPAPGEALTLFSVTPEGLTSTLPGE